MLRRDLQYKQEVFANDGLDYSIPRLCMTDGTSAILLYRAMRWCKQNRLAPLAFAFQVLNKWLNQCVLGSDTDFEAGFVLMHPNGVIMNARVKGGKEVVIESGVVIGSEKGATPVLGNNVFVGAGAKIIGGISVGNNTKIGANAVVVHDVPDNTTVVGIPARPLKRSSARSQS